MKKTNAKSRALQNVGGKGYNRVFRTKFGLRKYNRKTSLQRFRRTGKFRYVTDGSGHEAGRKWAAEKQIDPNSRNTRYSKNSPSFDEGVFEYKQSRKSQALSNKKNKQE